MSQTPASVLSHVSRFVSAGRVKTGTWDCDTWDVTYALLPYVSATMTVAGFGAGEGKLTDRSGWG